MSFTSETVCSAKLAVAELLFEAGCEEVRVPTKTWFRLMEGENSVVKQLWNECLAQAAPALLDEGYVKSVYAEGATSVEMVDWKRVPCTLFVCVVLGLDTLVTTEEGDTVGVITTLPKDSGSEDIGTLIKMRPLLDYLGVDALVWCQVNLSAMEIGCITHYTNRKQSLAKDMQSMLVDIEEKWMHEWVVGSDPSRAASSVEEAATPTMSISATKTM